MMGGNSHSYDERIKLKYKLLVFFFTFCSTPGFGSHTFALHHLASLPEYSALCHLDAVQ